MNFSKFLNILFENTNQSIKNKKKFVVDLFESNGISFFGGTNKAQKLISEGPTRRPIDAVLREDYLNKCDTTAIKNFLFENIEQIKIHDLFHSFQIPNHEKKDFNILIEAIAIQFENYIKFEESELNTSVYSIYIMLLDQYGNGSIPNANELALLSAKEALYSALSHIATLEKSPQNVLEYKGPFENFFSDINKVFRNFESKCNREGLNLFRSIRNDVLFTVHDQGCNFNIDNYLELITTPGSLPIELEKRIYFIIYDNHSPIDKSTEVVIDIYDDFEESKIINALETAKPYNFNEYHFTQFISFNIKGKNQNLLDDALYILEKVEIILNILEDNFNKTEEIRKINKKIERLAKTINFHEMHFMRDGVYYPLKKEIDIAPCLEQYLEMDDGSIIKPGDIKASSLDPLPFYKNVNFKSLDDILFRFFSHQIFIWKSLNFNDLMCNAITINEDGTNRYYMFVPTCKAKIYRMIRKIADRVIGDNTIGFVIQNLTSINKKTNLKDVKKTYSTERIETGETAILCFGYMYDQTKTLIATVEEAKKNECNLLTNYVSTSYTPLIYIIKANAEARKQLQNKNPSPKNK